MPCDSIITNTVDLDVANKNGTLLRAALEAMGAYGITASQSFFLNGEYYQIVNGQLRSSAANLETTANLVKRSYSAEVVKAAAKRNGWQVKQTAAFAYEVVRR